METLLFLNNRHHPGENVTVRKGRKWSDRLEVGEHVTLAATNGDSPCQYAAVVGLLRCRLADCPPALLALEHDPSCRTLEGLLEALRAAYGRDLCDEQLLGSEVTVVLYRIGLLEAGTHE